jgi:hypothetical protein
MIVRRSPRGSHFAATGRMVTPVRPMADAYTKKYGSSTMPAGAVQASLAAFAVSGL